MVTSTSNKKNKLTMIKNWRDEDASPQNMDGLLQEHHPHGGYHPKN